MKHQEPCINALALPVTPFVGVWIETQKLAEKQKKEYVTPFVGVWIETNYRSLLHHPMQVTPFVGVWIETC